MHEVSPAAPNASRLARRYADPSQATNEERQDGAHEQRGKAAMYAPPVPSVRRDRWRSAGHWHRIRQPRCVAITSG